MVGIGTAVLGYSDRDITRTAKNVIDNGSMTTLNPPEDVELAEMLLKIHPGQTKLDTQELAVKVCLLLLD